MMVAHERLIHDLRRADEEKARRIEPLSVGTIAYFLGRRDASGAEWSGGEAKQACQVANERSLAWLTYIHSTKRGRKGGETHLLNCSSPRGEAGGRGGGAQAAAVGGRHQMQCGRRRGSWV